jgi:hypothetical protein
MPTDRTLAPTSKVRWSLAVLTNVQQQRTAVLGPVDQTSLVVVHPVVLFWKELLGRRTPSMTTPGCVRGIRAFNNSLTAKFRPVSG